jgi:hypothetical protein
MYPASESIKPIPAAIPPPAKPRVKLRFSFTKKRAHSTSSYCEAIYRPQLDGDATQVFFALLGFVPVQHDPFDPVAPAAISSSGLPQKEAGHFFLAKSLIPHVGGLSA